MELLRDAISLIHTFLIGANNYFLWGPYLMIPLLLLTGIYLTLRVGFIQIRRFGHSLAVISGVYDDPEDEGDINHFQALSAALSATIGIGNIGGVAFAIHTGGPGALFWMWVTAFFGMATKYVTCTLGHHFRKVHEDGSVSGGPMYYIEKGLGKRWRSVALLFAICGAGAAFGAGNMVQANNVADILQDNFVIPNWLSGLVMAGCIWLVIVGGIRRIGKVASRLVPTMCIIYVSGAVVILMLHVERIPAAFALIFRDAFNPAAAAGGFLGASFFMVLRWGVARGLFSNEAGLGSAPIAHAAAKTKEAVREGIVAMIGPFVDTIVICSMTALVLITTGAWHTSFENTFSPERANMVIYKDLGEGIDYVQLRTAPRFNGELAIAEGRTISPVTLIAYDGVVFGAESPERALSPGSPPQPRFLLGDTPFTGTLLVRDGLIIGTASNPTSSPSIMIHGKTLKNQVSLTREAFILGFDRMAGLGAYGGYIVTLAVVLFAFSTAISWSYYGDRCIEYLLGAKAILPYKWVYVFLHWVGAVVSIRLVWDLADFMNGLMALPNLIGVIALSGVLVKLTNDYLERPHKRLRKFFWQK